MKLHPTHHERLASYQHMYTTYLPAHAVVGLSFAGNDLVVAVVLEAEYVSVCRDLVVPDLFEGCDEV